MANWTPESWQGRTATQLPDYPDPQALEDTVQRMSKLPPLVTSWEIESLRERLAAAALGESFLLQGGDCAESFDDCDVDQITAKLKILFNMSLVLVHASRKPVIRVGDSQANTPNRVVPTARNAMESICPPTAVTSSTGRPSPVRTGFPIRR